MIHLGPDPTRAVYSDPQFIAAMNKPISDTFEMKRIVDQMYSKGIGRLTIFCSVTADRYQSRLKT